MAHLSGVKDDEVLMNASLCSGNFSWVVALMGSTRTRRCLSIRLCICCWQADEQHHLGSVALAGADSAEATLAASLESHLIVANIFHHQHIFIDI